MSDHDLTRQSLRGDLASFHEEVDRYAPEMFRLAYALVGNAADAEDVVQEAFAGAWRGWAAFRRESSAKTWLTRIVMNQAARSRRGRSKRGAPLDPSSTPTGESLTVHEARMDVQSALESLSAEHREVIVLREYQGMSYDEMAAALEIPRGTVESRLFRARQELKDLLKAYRT